MNHAIELLEKELVELNKPVSEEDDDLIGAYICMRQELEVKTALKVLRNFIELQEQYKQITWK